MWKLRALCSVGREALQTHTLANLTKPTKTHQPFSLRPLQSRYLSTSDGQGGDPWQSAWQDNPPHSAPQPPPPPLSGDDIVGQFGAMAVADAPEGTEDDDELDEMYNLDLKIDQMRAFLRSNDGTTVKHGDLLKQVRHPGLRNYYLKDSEKQEMYKLYNKDKKEYNVERLAKDFRITRQRVLAILWLKRDEEEMERRYGYLDDSIEKFMDNCPEYFESTDREFHVSRLPLYPRFRVMPEDWDGKVKDSDEKLWEISQEEDRLLFEDFVQRMEYNKAKLSGKIKRKGAMQRKPKEGWKIVIEDLDKKDKTNKFDEFAHVSLTGRRTRRLNRLERLYKRGEGALGSMEEIQKMFKKSKTVRERRKRREDFNNRLRPLLLLKNKTVKYV